MQKNERSEYCSNLRKLIKNCQSSSKQKFHGTGTQDAGEFVQFLFNIFEINNMKTLKKTFVTNDLEKDTKDVVKSSKNTSLKDILKAVASFYKVEESAILEKNRKFTRFKKFVDQYSLKILKSKFDYIKSTCIHLK